MGGLARSQAHEHLSAWVTHTLALRRWVEPSGSQASCHHEQWLHHQHALAIPAVLVGTVDTGARITVLAGDLRVDVEAFVSILAFWEELTLLSRMVILTLSSCEVTLGPMLAPDLALLSL